MTTQPYQGVILAAGHGSRMGPFGDQVPKPIAPICNKPLIVYQLEHMRRLGIEDVIIVIGHLGHRITQTLGDGSRFGVRIRYVEQQEQLGLAHAVGQLEQHIETPFLLILGDIFFDIPDMTPMVRQFEEHGAAAVLAVKEETEAEAIRRNFAVFAREDGTVYRVIEKPRQLARQSASALHPLKGCGLYLFALPIFDAIRRTPRTALRDEYELTDSIQILIDYEYPVRTAPVVAWDINLTVIGDLIECCAYQLTKLGNPYLVGDGCALADGVELVDTVIGDNVTVTRPIRFERCVLLPNVSVHDGRSYRDTVFTAEANLSANSGG